MNGRVKLLLIALLFIVSVFSISSDNGVILTGDNVTIEFSASVYNFDFNTSIVNFVVGNGEVLIGLDVGVLGMREGETKNLTLPPVVAYGLYDPELVFSVPVGFFETHNSSLPVVGEIVTLNGVDGMVIELINDLLIVDTNHPLAGQEMNFTIKVLDVV